MRVHRITDCPDVPWKNGQGTTREIARHPQGGASFDWRLSLAEVGHSGSFSAFTGYERIITLLRGDGFALRFANGEEHALRAPNEPYRFDGGAEVACVLGGGPSNDLNLMVRQDLGPATCGVVTFSGRHRLTAVPGAARLVVCLSDAVRLAGGGPADRAEAQDLGRWDTAVFEAAEGPLTELDCESVRPAAVFHAVIPRHGAAEAV